MKMGTDWSAKLVSVIIPTNVRKQRERMLDRAIASLRRQTHRSVEIILSVNGGSANEETLSRLAQVPNLRLCRIREADQKLAMVAGRREARGDYFCFLDDDDELLPNSIEIRAAVLDQAPGTDAVTSGGYERVGVGEDMRDAIRRDSFEASDLLGTLFHQNWNASCGTLFRSAHFGAEFFDEDYRHPRYRALGFCPPHVDKGFSWTFATAKMCLDHKASFIDVPGYIVNLHADSESNSLGYLLSGAAVWRAILHRGVPRKYRKALRRKLADVHHDLAGHYLRAGEWRNAWKHHLQTLLLPPSGLRYLSFTRHLLALGIA
jgi:glycosyltransferase involved in cell wall biosynthesis